MATLAPEATGAILLVPNSPKADSDFSFPYWNLTNAKLCDFL